jgi:hypothetical protein
MSLLPIKYVFVLAEKNERRRSLQSPFPTCRGAADAQCKQLLRRESFFLVGIL